MRKLPKLMIVLSATLIFLWGSAVSAFEFLYEKDGISYYRTDAGNIISKEIPEGTEGLVLLHQERDGKRKYYQAPDGKIWASEQYGLPVLLSNAPDYNWWYGCSPTSAGMMMGYYDYNGYGGLYYQQLVPGGPAELSTYPSGSPAGTYRAQAVIASDDHIADYWVAYDESGNDPNPGGHSDNCLADFMETSKDSAGNSDGGTTFWYAISGAQTTPTDIEGASVESSSGMYGIKEYVEYRGYGYTTLYNQYGDFMGLTYGCTFADFQAEIDAGRIALLHTENHTMSAYGYATPSTVYVHDTWDPHDPGTMTWGGSYGGVPHRSMTFLTLTGGSATPDDVVAGGAQPGALLLLLGD